MIKNRAASLTLIIFIYVLAAFCGLFLYDFFAAKTGFSYQLCLLLADVAATFLVFIFSLIFRNASVYDPYWSVQPPVILALAISRSGGFTGSQSSVIFSTLIFVAVLFWALRLTANWVYNFKSFEYQDWRYVMLKEKSGRLYPFVNFFGIHLFPTFVVYLCVLPAVTAIAEGAAFRPACLIFIILSFLAAVFRLCIETA